MASAASSRNPKDTFALKQKAMKYYNENGIPIKMEEVLNTMFYEDPPDVHGYLVNYFSKFTKPATLKKVVATQVFDSTGKPTIQTDVVCTVNNTSKTIISSTLPPTNIKAKPEDYEKSEVDAHNSVASAIQTINNNFGEQLCGLNPKQQSEVDAILLSVIDKLKQEEQAKKTSSHEEEPVDPSQQPNPIDDKEKKKSAKHLPKKLSREEFELGKGSKSSAPIVVLPDRPAEVFPAGSEFVGAVSQAVCACAAVANDEPIYRHVANLSRSKGALHEFRLPLPMVTIIQSGKSVPGKVNCVKEYMIVPGVGMSVDQSTVHIQNIFQYVAKSYATKLGPAAKFVNESGALCPQLESPTQALELLQEAVNAQGLTIGEDMHLAINASAYDFFDYEKGRYEVTTGTFKTPDEMVEFWADIVMKYPSLIALIDPLRGEDLDPWLRLGERLSDGIFIIGNRFYSRPALTVDAPPPLPIQTSGAVVYMEHINTVTDVIKFCNLLHERKNEVVVSTNTGETTDTFIVDLAVGVGARFLKIGGPSRGERTAKLNRLVEIFRELEPAQQEEENGEDSSEQAKKEENTESDVEDLKIDVALDEDGDMPEEKEEIVECTEKVDDTPSLWGQNEKSRLKLHAPFMYPVIEIPPPPTETDREGEIVDESASK